MGCVAAKIKLTFYEGGTFNKTFQWKTGTSATPVDLTGYSARMAIRSSISASAVVLELDNVAGPWSADGSSGIYLDDDPTNGYYQVYIKDNDSIVMCATHVDIDGVYDLFLTTPSGETVLKQYGPAKLIAAVRRTST